MSENICVGFSMGEQLKDYPDFLSPDDLVKMGLFTSTAALYFARIRGNSPDFIKMGRRIIYPKVNVIRFITERMMLGDITREERMLNE